MYSSIQQGHSETDFAPAASTDCEQDDTVADGSKVNPIPEDAKPLNKIPVAGFSCDGVQPQ